MFIFLIPAGKLRDIILYFILIKYTNTTKFIRVDFIIQACLTITNILNVILNFNIKSQSKMMWLFLN
jgi:hypothetical protein